MRFAPKVTSIFIGFALVTGSVALAQTTQGGPGQPSPPNNQVPPASSTTAPGQSPSDSPSTPGSGSTGGGPAPSTQGAGPLAPDVSLPPSSAAATGTTIPANPSPETEPTTTPAYDTVGTGGARAAGMAPPGTHDGDFMDTRLTWTFGDDDFLHKTGELIPFSQKASIGERGNYRLFFDNLNSRFSGRENLTHLVLYKKMPGFLPHLTTEAAMVLRFDLASLSANTGNLNSALYDAGSYIRVFYNTGSHAKDGISAVFFPLDTDRFRLGYLYDISWGGTNQSINESVFPRIQGSSPGLKIQYDADKFYVFGGFKTATIMQPEQVLRPGGENEVDTTRIGQANYGFLAGFGVDALENLRFEAGAGYFQQGKFDLDDVRGKSVFTYGTSGRVVLHHQMPVPMSVDFRLYRNDPSAPMILFAPEKYSANELAWSISMEGSYLKQHLKDFDVAGAVRDQGATAAALQGVVKAGYLRLSVTGVYRDLNFNVRSVPGFIPFETLPQSAKTDPEIFGAIAGDYYIESLRLTPGIGGGIQLPSTFRSEFTDGGVPASRTIVVRRGGDESILPYDQGRTPILQARASVRWNVSSILSTVVWMQYVRDNNGSLLTRDPTEGTASLRVLQSPNRLGMGLSLQAKF